VTAAWVGNREIHLPSQLNKFDQLNPIHFALGDDLALKFNDGTAQAAGYAPPYPNFANDFGNSSTVAESLTPFPQYTNVFNNFEGSGTAYYEGLQLEAEKRFTNGLSFLISYTLSRTMDNTSSGFTSFANGALNRYNQKAEWAISGSDEPNNFKASGTYELPIGPGKQYLNNKNVTGQVLGGWQLGWILDYESGTAFGVSQNLTFPYPNGGNRPNRSSAKLSTASYNKERDYFLGKNPNPQIFDPGAFTAADDFTLGDTKRNYGELRNPPFLNENLNARKKFFFGERFSGILQVDYFNAFNRTKFNGPDTNISDGNFGLAESQGSNISNRQGQVSFRLEF